MNATSNAEFKALCDPLVRRIIEVSRSIPQLMEETVAVREETSEVLHRSANECPGEHSRAIYLTPHRLLRQMSTRIITFNETATHIRTQADECSRQLKEWLGGANNILNNVHPAAQASQEELALIKRWMTKAGMAPYIWQLFSMLPVLSMAAMLPPYRDAALGFLGRPPGRRYDFRRGLNKLLEGGRDTVIDAATLKFGAVLLRATIAATTPPKERDVQAMIAAADWVERAGNLADRLNQLEAQACLVDAVFAISKEAISESYRQITSEGPLILDLLRINTRGP